MITKKFLLLKNNYMAFYTLQDVKDLDAVYIVHRKKVSKNKLTNLLFNIHNSGKIEKYITLPFRSVWDTLLFKKVISNFSPDYIVFTSSWYSAHLVQYFRNNIHDCKLILQFSDMVSKELGDRYDELINKIPHHFDGVLVYSQEDAIKYGFTYHSIGYSPVKKELLKSTKKYDVVFVGADKGRINKIRKAYNIFTSAGLSCFFYVILVKKEDRLDDGIIYADKVMDFEEYLSYEVSANCLFEIVQDGSSGRTYRMMESIIYNKPLITNCKEILDTPYYRSDYVQLYNDVSEINPSFVNSQHDHVNFNYKGDFSPIRDLEFIEKNW